MQELNVHEMGPRGEPILIMILRHIHDPQSRVDYCTFLFFSFQQKYIKLLLDEKVNVNLIESRDKRTALMICCVEDDLTAEGRILMNVVRRYFFLVA